MNKTFDEKEYDLYNKIVKMTMNHSAELCSSCSRFCPEDSIDCDKCYIFAQNILETIKMNVGKNK